MRTHSLRRKLKIARYYVASKGGKRRDRGRKAREGEPGGVSRGMEAAPDNVTKTSKCTTPAHLFAKSRGRVEEMLELGERGTGSELRFIAICLTTFDRGKIV